jgi:hypothetical protein
MPLVKERLTMKYPSRKQTLAALGRFGLTTRENALVAYVRIYKSLPSQIASCTPFSSIVTSPELVRRLPRTVPVPEASNSYN